MYGVAEEREIDLSPSKKQIYLVVSETLEGGLRVGRRERFRENEMGWGGGGGQIESDRARARQRETKREG